MSYRFGMQPAKRSQTSLLQDLVLFLINIKLGGES
jgi:hypothetical protein